MNDTLAPHAGPIALGAGLLMAGLDLGRLPIAYAEDRAAALLDPSSGRRTPPTSSRSAGW